MSVDRLQTVIKVGDSFHFIHGSGQVYAVHNWEGPNASFDYARLSLNAIAQNGSEPKVSDILDIGRHRFLLLLTDGRLAICNSRRGNVRICVDRQVTEVFVDERRRFVYLTSNNGFHSLDLEKRSLKLLRENSGSITYGTVDWMLSEEFNLGPCVIVSDKKALFLSTNNEGVERASINQGEYTIQYSFAGTTIPSYILSSVSHQDLTVSTLLETRDFYIVNFVCSSLYVYLVLSNRAQSDLLFVRSTLGETTFQQQVLHHIQDKYFYNNLVMVIEDSLIATYFTSFMMLRIDEDDIAVLPGPKCNVVKFVLVKQGYFILICNFEIRHLLTAVRISSFSPRSHVHKLNQRHTSNVQLVHDTDYMCLEYSDLNSSTLQYDIASLHLDRHGHMSLTVLFTIALIDDGFKISRTPSNCLAHSLTSMVPFLNSLNPISNHREIFRFENSAKITLYGMIYHPLEFQHDKKYPVVLHLYGGPRVQTIIDAFYSSHPFICEQFQKLGFFIVSIDCTGSFYRGYDFESKIRFKFPDVQLSDYCDLIRTLESFPFMDLSQLVLHGWSFGGYLALKFMEEYPEIVSRVICGAPVVRWQLYDSAYTERYLGMPCQNEAIYNRANFNLSETFVKTFCRSLSTKGESPRILLISGTNDDNVLVENIYCLRELLDLADVPYILKLFPGERHGLVLAQNKEDYLATATDFLNNV